MRGGEAVRFPTHIVSAGGFVEDGNGNVLLVKVRDEGWVIPGGITEVGENLIDGLIREIKEESGIDAEVLHLVNVVSNTGIHKWYDGVTDVPTKIVFDFVCRAVGGELAASDETSECEWVPRERVLEYITVPYLRTRCQAWLEFDGSVNYIEYTTPTPMECVVKFQRRI